MDYIKELGEESSVREEIEDVLRQMCAGKGYREYSDDMIDTLYPNIEHILNIDLLGADDNGEDLDRLLVDEDMVVTAMMMALNE